jgi:hypothetical protein
MLLLHLFGSFLPSAKPSSRAPGLATVIEKLQKEIDDKAAGSPPEPWPWDGHREL